MSKALRSPALRRGAIALTNTALVAGCASPSTHATAADQVAGPQTRTTIGRLPVDAELGVHPNLDALANSVVAVTAPKRADGKETVNSGELWFARLDGSPSKIDGLAPVPDWAQPHFGTDAQGRQLVVYPRCASGHVGDCDLYAWDVDRDEERKLTEVDADGVGELEGTMQHGAVAWTVAAESAASADAAQWPSGWPTLKYRSASGVTSTLSTRGGTDLALRSGSVAQVLYDEATDVSHVQLIRPGGRTTSLLRYEQAAAPRWATGLRFFGNELRFGIASQDHTSLYRVPLARPSAKRAVQLNRVFTTLAFARRDLLVWADADTTEASTKLISDVIPKRFR